MLLLLLLLLRNLRQQCSFAFKDKGSKNQKQGAIASMCRLQFNLHYVKKTEY